MQGRSGRDYFGFKNRLRPEKFSQPLRGFAAGLAGILLLAGLFILLTGLGLFPFESAVNLPETLSEYREIARLPFSLVLLVLLGLGFVAGALVYASTWPAQLLTGLVGLTLSVFLLDPAHLTTSLFASPGLLNLLARLPQIFVWLAACCAAGLILLTFFRAAWTTRLRAVFAVGMFWGNAMALVGWKVIWDLIASWAGFDGLTVQGVILPLGMFGLYMAPLVWLAGAVFFWQALAEAKIYSREIGLRVGQAADRRPWLLAVLFTLKLLWLAAGFLSGVRGAGGEVWTGSLQDGPLAWLLAAVYAGVAGWWLLRRRQPDAVRGLAQGGAHFLTAGFLLVFILAFIVFMLAGVFISVQNIPYFFSNQTLGQCFQEDQGSAGAFLACLSGGLAGTGLLWTQVFVALLIPLGVVFSRVRRYRHLAPVYLLAGVWALPALIQAVDAGANTSFEYLTFDVFLTLALLVVYLLFRKGRTSPGRIGLVLVVSSLAALLESLIPAGWAGFGFALFLVVPVVYQLLFDASELNAAGSRQAGRILRTLGLQAGLMVVVAWAFALGQIGPGLDGFEQVAQKIFLPPILGLLLVETDVEPGGEHLKEGA